MTRDMGATQSPAVATIRLTQQRPAGQKQAVGDALGQWGHKQDHKSPAGFRIVM